MKLSSLSETTNAMIFGAVVCGDIEDDGGPVGCAVLAMALELWRLTGRLDDVVAGLEAWRYGEPWEAWVEGAYEGWLAMRDDVRRGLVRIVALVLYTAAERRRATAERALQRALAAATAAAEVTDRSARLLAVVTCG